ncbi:MAG: hypothetical protein J7J11_00660, partial [Desulfurococcales archaeon]|nr:hypothetical protein [Desulfurococcales archaeon]
MKLPPRHYSIVKVLAESRGILTAKSLAEKLGKKVSDLMRDLEELSSKNLIEVSRKKVYRIRVSQLGMEYLKKGLPEEKLFEIVKSLGKDILISKLRAECGLSNNEFAAAVGILRKFSIIDVSKGTARYTGTREAESSFMKYVREVKDKLSELASPRVVEKVPEWVRKFKRRGFVVVEDAKEIYVTLSERALSLYSSGLIRESVVVTRLTPEIISSGL